MDEGDLTPKKTMLEWFGCEEGMTGDEIRVRLNEIWEWGMQGLKDAEEWHRSELERRSEDG